MNVYTEAKLASLFNVTTTSPYECDLKMAVPVKGRKSYNNAKAVSIRVAENKAFGYAVSIMLLVDGHYRKNALRRRKEKHTRSVGYINKKPLPVEIRKAAVNLEFNVYLI